jgi:acetyl esterase/lipase
MTIPAMRRISRLIVPSLCVAAFFCCAAVKPDIEYATAAGESLRLDASIPDGPGPFPIVILIHGGGWSSGDKAKDFTDLFTPLTQNHFVWFSLNYRFAPKFRWPACFDDVQTAIRWVKAHAADYHGDPTRIALLGYSAGGQLATLAAVTAQPDTQVQAVVGFAPPTDLELDLPTRGGLSPSLQALLNRPHELTPDARSQLRDLSALDHLPAPDAPTHLPPFLLVHGTADKSVPYPGSLNFQAALQKLHIPCDLITLPNAPHNILTWQAAKPHYELEVIHWLQKTLENP